MPSFTKITNFHLFVTSIRPQFSLDHYGSNGHLDHFLRRFFTGKRWLSGSAEWATQSEFVGTNAYDILGVSRNSSFAEIKASFRKLAKQTHPDLLQSQSHSSYASNKFIEILAAYEILSDSHKRAHYDRHLLSRNTSTDIKRKQDPITYNYNSYGHETKCVEAVEWLKWYRYTINDILSERRVTSGSGYFDILERDFYSALHMAYYGPEIKTLNMLPNCFEAEERSVQTTSEVLHLVSGRDLFGMVCLANKYPELSHSYNKKLQSSDLSLVPSTDNMCQELKSDDVYKKNLRSQFMSNNYQSFDSYRDLELHISGRVVAVATRVPPERCASAPDADSEDQIHVYLTSHGDQLDARKVYPGDSSKRLGITLGVIKGLGTSTEEGTCYVYDNSGIKTHVIMKHRTLMVKHLHWYRVGEKFSVCECRCSRARLPPSKFWLFEPRSALHDIGGWYVETFGRDKKGKNVPAQRRWDSLDTDEQYDERLHPAMYLLALAYRSLDIETVRLRKQTVKDKIEANMSRVFSWCKRCG